MSHVIYMWGEWKAALMTEPESICKKKKKKKPRTRWYAHKTNRREVRPERGA